MISTLKQWKTEQEEFLSKVEIVGEYGPLWLFRIWQMMLRFRANSPPLEIDTDNVDDLKAISPDAGRHFEEAQAAAGGSASLSEICAAMKFTDPLELLSMYMCFFMDPRVKTRVERLGGLDWLLRERQRLRAVVLTYKGVCGQWPHPLELLANAERQWFLDFGNATEAHGPQSIEDDLQEDFDEIFGDWEVASEVDNHDETNAALVPLMDRSSPFRSPQSQPVLQKEIDSQEPVFSQSSRFSDRQVTNQHAIVAVSLTEAEHDLLMRRKSITSSASADLFLAARDSAKRCQEFLQKAVRRRHGCPKGIVERTKDNQTDLEEAHPEWGREYVKLCLAAMIVLGYRPRDTDNRDLVELMWIILGESHLVAHRGRAYVYSKIGHWEPYAGVFPEYMMLYVKTFMHRLEGVFRMFKTGAVRDTAGVLEQMRMLHERKSGTEDDLLQTLTTIAVKNPYDRSGDHGDSSGMAPESNSVYPLEGDEDTMPADLGPPAPAASSHPTGPKEWFMNVATAVQAVSSRLRNSLYHTKTITWFCEWCDTPKRATPGVAFRDACYLYDVKGEVVHFISGSSADLRIYIGIDRDLLTSPDEDEIRSVLSGVDPTLKSCIEEVQTIYERTFWNLAHALEVHRCMETLAKRGRNVDYLTFIKGPGGVGLSLISAHLNAMYGPLHQYFDPSVFYDDDELRKQAETMVGAVFFTGQERPEGTKHECRLDLLKKFGTGEGIMGRLPYGILSKLITVIGWKRFELNRMFSFEPVVEGTFGSIMRRSLVIEIESRFLDNDYLKVHVPNHEDFGIFARDPKAMDFLISGPGVAAGHVIQLAHECDYDESRCRSIISGYVLGGGDKGLTEKTLRDACRLPPAPERKRGERIDLTTLGLDVTVGNDASNQSNEHFLETTTLYYARQMLDRSWDHITVTYFLQIPLSSEGSNGWSKRKLFEELMNSQFWCKVLSGAPRSTLAYFPKIITIQNWPEQAKSASGAKPFDLPEKYDLRHFAKFIHAVPARQSNALFLSRAYQAAASFEKEKSNGDLMIVETLSKRSEKIWMNEKSANRLLISIYNQMHQGALPEEKDIAPDSVVDGMPLIQKGKGRGRGGRRGRPRYSEITPSKRMRTSSEGGSAFATSSSGTDCGAFEGMSMIAPSVISELRQNCEKFPVSTTMTKKYESKRTWGGRLYVIGNGMQQYSQRLQVALAPETWDADVVNAMPNILWQLVTKVEIKSSASFAKELDVLRLLAEDRARACRELLRWNVACAKKSILSVLSGSAIPAKLRGNEFMQALNSASRFLRWLACGSLSETYAALADDVSVPWPEASVLAHLWQNVESRCVESWVEMILAEPVTHLSLHFDGVRVFANNEDAESESAKAFCREASNHILGSTGFALEIKIKEHKTFVSLLNGLDFANAGMPFLASYEGSIKACLFALEQNAVQSENVDFADLHGMHTYNRIACDMAINLTPRFPWNGFEDLVSGKYLVHSEHLGSPFVVAAVVSEGKDISFYIGNRVATTRSDVADEFVAQAIDAATIVVYEIDDTEKPEILDSAQKLLLDLQAGSLAAPMLELATI